MKIKTLVTALLLTCIVNSYAQEIQAPLKLSQKRNELKVNAPWLVAGLPELQYERILNDETSLGFSALFPIDQDLDFAAFGPYYRVHFGDAPASGFFVEANGGAFVSDSDMSFGLGFAVGYKLLSHRGWVLDGYGGLGRMFNDNFLPIYPRFGLCFGRRFGS